MKLIKIKPVIMALLMFSHVNQCAAEGFLAGTLVKTLDGYIKIENISIGDRLTCFDSEKNLVESVVTYVGKKSVSQYVRMQFADESVEVACDQLFWNAENDAWIDALSFQNCDVLTGGGVDVYLIGVTRYHNFFVTKADICVHNFFPPLVVAISVAFGSGTIEIASVSAGLAGLGAFLGYKWHKKDKESKITIQPRFYGSGMMPEDPEDEKKRKRNEAREEYRSLTKKEAKEIAKNFGHKEVKDHPCGNTRNQPVFFNGKNYISPDIDGHNGGMWKIFDRRGNILHTASRKFERIVKVYKK